MGFGHKLSGFPAILAAHTLDVHVDPALHNGFAVHAAIHRLGYHSGCVHVPAFSTRVDREDDCLKVAFDQLKHVRNTERHGRIVLQATALGQYAFSEIALKIRFFVLFATITA